MSEPRLTDEEIDAGLARLPGWSRDGDEIRRTVTAPEFLTGIDWVRRVGEAAEAANHHPDIDIRWCDVTFALSTHDSGGLTRLDLDLAGTIDRITGGDSA